MDRTVHLDRETFTSRINKMVEVYQLTKGVCNKRSVPIYTNLKHYYTVIRSEGMYAVESLAMHKKGMNEKFEAKERKLLRKTLRLIKENGECRRRHSNDVYLRVKKITNTIWKMSIVSFLCYIRSMSLGKRQTGFLHNL